MQWFTWLVHYLVKFLPNLSIICEGLCQLSWKDASSTWQSEQEAAFKRIKQLVTAPPVLQLCDITKEVTIQCDASSLGLGVVLMRDGHPIAYDSKALTTTKRNFPKIKKKHVAIVLVACTKFH